MANKQIYIDLLNYHNSQQKVVDNAKRFNTLNCGRRWGKNELGKDLLITPAIEDSMPVAWFEPTYKSLSEVWKEVKGITSPLIKTKSEQLKQIELITGGIIDFWSLDDTNVGRGRKYKRVIVNEVAVAKKFDDTWQQAIRPTLTDYQGDAWLLSTPKGMSNFWYDFCQKDDHGWKNFTLPTSENPYIPKEEIEAARNELPSLIFAQEYLAHFVDLTEELFFYAFDEDNQVTKPGQTLVVDEMEHLSMSFDFNVYPTTCMISQKLPRKGIFIYEIVQRNGGTRALCQALKKHIYHKGGLRITGDCTGFSSSSAAGHINDFKIICEELGVMEQHLEFNRRANASHMFSRELCNSALHLIPVLIDREKCQPLIYDLRTGMPTKSGGLFKDRAYHCQDAGDCFRYQINAWFKDYEELKIFAKNLEWLKQET